MHTSRLLTHLWLVGGFALAVGCGDDGSSPASTRDGGMDGAVEAGSSDGGSGGTRSDAGTRSDGGAEGGIHDAGGALDANAMDADAADAFAADATTGGDGSPDAGGDGGDDSGPAELTFDPTFNGGELLTTSLGRANHQGYLVLRQGADRLLVVGFNVPNHAPFVARVQDDGSVDASFGSDGMALLAGGDPEETFGGAALQSDGKILVATGRGTYGGSITRLTADGALDTGFGNGGRLTLTSMAFLALAVDADDGIYLGGYGLAPNRTWNLLAHLTPDGALDPAFGDDGMRILDPLPRDLLVDGSGRLLLMERGSTIVLHRLSAAGQPDTAFNGTGSIDTGLAPLPYLAPATRIVRIQDDGRILVGGRMGSSTTVLRLTEAGAPDASFDDDGYATVGIGSVAAGALSLAVDGGVYVAADDEIYLLDASGALDPDFAGGSMRPDFLIHGLRTDADGSLHVAGTQGAGGGYLTGAVAHVRGDGSLDDDFGTDGITLLSADAAFEQVRALAFTDDDEIVAAGVWVGGAERDGWAIARYQADGTLDPSFNGGQPVTTPGTSRLTSARAAGLFLDDDQRIVVGGSGIEWSYFRAARFTAAGALDSDYGTAGEATFDVGTAVICHGAALDDDGRLVLVGVNSAGGGDWRFVVARLDADGQPDTTFNGTGFVTQDVGHPTLHRGGAFSVAIQDDGKILVAGSSFEDSGSPSYSLVVLRYEEDGSPDTDFGDDGVVLLDAIPGQDFWVEIPRAITLLPDGKILLAGLAGYLPGGVPVLGDEIWTMRWPRRNVETRMLMVRLTSDGEPDASFATTGVLSSTLGSDVAIAHAVQVRADGSAWVGGERLDPDGKKRGFVARVTAAGQLDEGFGEGGYELLPASVGAAIGGPSSVRALLTLPDGALVGGGEHYRSPTGSDFALFRVP